MEEKDEKTRKCMKCKKEKSLEDGYSKMGGIFFCCKECCDDPSAKEEGESNTCEFC